MKKNLGLTQKRIIAHLESYGGSGYLGPSMVSPWFKGFYWEEIEKSINRLLDRKIIRKKRPTGIYEIIYNPKYREIDDNN